MTKKLPNLQELFIQDCRSVDEELFEEDLTVFNKIKILSISVTNQNIYFNEKDVDIIINKFKGLKKLFINSWLYAQRY